MGNLYLNLRGKLASSNKRVADIAREVGVTPQHINNILAGRTHPRIDLCYDILSKLGEPPEKLPYYFPPNGLRTEAPLRVPPNTVIRIGGRRDAS